MNTGANEGYTAWLCKLGTEANAMMQPGETLKQMIERKTREAIAAAHELGQKLRLATSVPGNYVRPCHWCDGTMFPTPTYGRLECQSCGAVSIVGRAKPVVHVEGRRAGEPNRESSVQVGKKE